MKLIVRKFVFFSSSDDTQREAKFKELELENERNKQVLTARIKQLQSEIDLLVKEKKNSNYLNFFLS
jgi:single-stranded DNA-specific DHH superfamily exonuclease